LEHEQQQLQQHFAVDMELAVGLTLLFYCGFSIKEVSQCSWRFAAFH